MAASLRVVESEGRAILPQADLSVFGDDGVVRVESDVDARFWVRIERQDGDDVVITDFTPGDRPEGELHRGLVMGVEALGRASFGRVVFRDLIPAGHQSPGFPLKVIEAADRVKRLSATLADALGRQVTHFSMQPRRGKLDAIVLLGDIDSDRAPGSGAPMGRPYS